MKGTPKEYLRMSASSADHFWFHQRSTDSEQVLKDVEFERLVVARVAALGDQGVVERADLVDEVKEQLPAVAQMVRYGTTALGADGLHIKPDEFTAAAVTGFLKDAHLVEGAPEVRPAEVFVLVVFQAVLVVEMDTRKLVMREGEGHLVARIQTGEECVRALNKPMDP